MTPLIPCNLWTTFAVILVIMLIWAAVDYIDNQEQNRRLDTILDDIKRSQNHIPNQTTIIPRKHKH